MREFVRELSREIRWTTKLIVLVLAIGFITGILYIGYAVNRELRESREQAEPQSDVISKLEEKLGQDERPARRARQDQQGHDEDRLARAESACRVRQRRLPDRRRLRSGRPARAARCFVIPTRSHSGRTRTSRRRPKTAVRRTAAADRLDDRGQRLAGRIRFYRHRLSRRRRLYRHEPPRRPAVGRGRSGQADDAAVERPRRVKRLVIYFPNFAAAVSVEGPTGRRSAKISRSARSIPRCSRPRCRRCRSTPIRESVAIGKTVVTMGYPSGPDRLLAMVDDDEAKSINARFGNSRQNLINFLAQIAKDRPADDAGRDHRSRRPPHRPRRKTAEGGSGAPLFGQTGKVIGVNFGVFTENTPPIWRPGPVCGRSAEKVRLEITRGPAERSSQQHPAKPPPNNSTPRRNNQVVRIKVMSRSTDRRSRLMEIRAKSCSNIPFMENLVFSNMLHRPARTVVSVSASRSAFC